VDAGDNIIVADYDSNKIKLFKNMLTFIFDVIVENNYELSGPQRICLDESNGFLYIAESNGSLLVLKPGETKLSCE